MFRRTVIPNKFINFIEQAFLKTKRLVDTEYRKTSIPDKFINFIKQTSIKVNRLLHTEYRKTVVRRDWINPEVIDFAKTNIIRPFGVGIGYGRSYGLIYGRT